MSGLLQPLAGNFLDVKIQRLENHLLQWQASHTVIVRAEHIGKDEFIAYKEIVWEKKRQTLGNLYRFEKGASTARSPTRDHVIEYDWYIETAYISLLTRMC